MSILIVAIVGLLLLASLMSWAWLEQRTRNAAHSRVQVGDLWEHIGVETHPRRKTRGLYEVVAANVNTEAGPDSWVMRTRDGRTLYMHHNARVKPDSDWVLCMRDGRPMRRAKDVKRTISRVALPSLLLVALSLCFGCAAVKPACAVIDVAHAACEYVTITYLAPDGTIKTERVPVAELATSAERARLARLAASK